MSKKLLLADDSITIQKVVELILADEDFEIKSVSTGEDAWNVIKEFKPDIVLADIEMPEMNGYQLCDHIKNDEDTRDIPVLLLAGAFEPIDEEMVKEVKADDYLVKPFESQELISKINAVLTEKEVSEESEAAVVAEVGEAEGDASPAEHAEVAESAEAAEAVEISEQPWLKEETGTWNLEEDITFEESVTKAPPLETGEEEIASEEAPDVASAESGVSETGKEPAKQAAEAVDSIIRDTVDNRVASIFERIDTETINNSITALIKDSVDRIMTDIDIKDTINAVIRAEVGARLEDILDESLPKQIEDTIKSTIEEMSSSLQQQIEKVIWETVPDLAETIITREIERIKSEF